MTKNPVRAAELRVAIGQRIRDMIKKRNLKIHEVAADVGMGSSPLISVLNGTTHKLSIDLLDELATVLDCNIIEFFDDIDIEEEVIREAPKEPEPVFKPEEITSLKDELRSLGKAPK